MKPRPDPAGRWRRLGALAVDDTIFVALVLGVAWDAVPEPLQVVFAFALLAFIIAQFVWLARRGQTAGKILLGIRIVDRESGRNAGFVRNVLLRFLLNRVISLIPGYLIVDGLFIFRKDRRCLHDMLAGTVVVRGQPSKP